MTIDRETIEALRDEPELLAIADAVQSTAARLGPVPSVRPWRRPVRLVAVALAAAAVVGIVLASPWEGGGPSFVDKALAAVGNRPVLYVVVRYSIGERIDLHTGASSPAHRDLELWYDQQTHVFRAIARLDGHVITRLVRRGNLGYEPFLLTTLYRKALKDGKLHKTGDAVIRGRRAIVVESGMSHRGRMRAYLDARSYRLVRLQYFEAGRLGAQVDVLRYETIGRGAAGLPATAPRGDTTRSSSGSSTVGYPEQGVVSLHDLRTVFGRPALWPGRSVQGHRLLSSQVATNTAESDGRKAHGSKLLLDYGPRPRPDEDAYLEIEEAPATSPLWRIESVYAPPAGYLDLMSGQTSTDGNRQRTQWTGTMTKHGFTIQLTSWSRSTLIAAARSMRPVP